MTYLKPWSHYRRFDKDGEILKHIIEVLTEAVLNNWHSYKTDIRPALGYQGNRITAPTKEQIDKNLLKVQQKYSPDPFIAELKDKKFFFWDQSQYFISHSAMREYEFKIFDYRNVFPRIYKESYRREIMDRIKENSKFGRY